MLKEKLKVGGKIIFVVPYDSYRYKPNDINYHLYSWSPMNLGNLFTEAGYRVIEAKEFVHRWPPFYSTLAYIFGKRIFNFLCVMYGWMRRLSCSQVRIVAERMSIEPRALDITP